MELILSDLVNKHKVSGVAFLDLSKSDGSLGAMIDGITNGVACEIRAMEVAMYIVKDAMEAYQEAQDITDAFVDTRENYRDSMDSACDSMDKAKSILKVAIDNFTHYPAITKTLESMFSLLSYYEAYAIIPVISGIQMQEVNNKIISTYFFKNPVTGLIKIGKSVDIKTRKQAVQCGSGVELDVLLVIDGDSERELHKKFAEYREHGEWFNDTDGKIAAYIANHKSSDTETRTIQ